MADDLQPLIDRIHTGVRRAKPRLVNPFSILFEKIYKVGNLLDVPAHLQKALPKVKVALVSMPTLPEKQLQFESFVHLNGSDLEEPPLLDRLACKRRLVTFDKAFSEKALESFSEALNSALVDQQANVVCFSELGFPSMGMKPLVEAVRLTSEMSKKHDALIIAGSSHDVRTLYNTGHLFHPGSGDQGHVFHKSISAISVDEHVSAPSVRRLPLVNIFGLKIASMICIDVADYASIASVVRCADKVDVLLVPCYTPGFDKMAKIAQVASEALGVVALVNASLPDEPPGLHQVWRLGKKKEPAPEELPSGAFVTCFDVFPEQLKDERSKMPAVAKRMRLLFGDRDIASIIYS